jgi:Protein of unknown function (DUF3383)
MSIDRFINLTVQVNNSGVARFGFGVVGILSHKSVFPERSRLYKRTADMISDGYPADSVEVRTATALEDQSPHPPSWLVLRANDAVPTQQYTQSAGTVADNTVYSIDVDGEGVTPSTATYTSGTGAIRAQIHAGLVAALNAVTGKNYLAAFAAAPVIAPKTFTADHTTSHLTTAAHGYLTGDGPVQLTNSGGALPTGLLLATNYWMVRIDANTFGLATSLANALASPPVLAAFSDNGTGTQTVSQNTTLRPDSAYTVTGSAPGDWFSLGVEDATLLNNAQTHADPGTAAALAAILVKDDTWFWFVSNFNSKAVAEAIAGFAESNGKVFVVDFVDTDAANTIVSGATDAPAALFGLGYKQTMYSYYSTPAAMMSAAFVGLLAPKNPGRWTAAFKTLVGVPPMALTPEQETNLENRRCGSYTTEGGRNVTWDGEVANTTYGFLDVFVKLAFVSNDLSTSLYGVLVGNDVVGFTDEDLQKFVAAGKGVIKRGVSDQYKIMAPGDPNDPNDPPPSFTVPRVVDIDPSARALRDVPDMQLTFRLQGAVQHADVTITASF